jgi:hypothetical protein
VHHPTLVLDFYRLFVCMPEAEMVQMGVAGVTPNSGAEAKGRRQRQARAHMA